MTFTPLGPIPNPSNPAKHYALPDGTKVKDQTRVLNVRLGDYPNRPVMGDNFHFIFNPNPDRFFSPHIEGGSALRLAGYGGLAEVQDLTQQKMTVPLHFAFGDGAVLSARRVRQVASPGQPITYWHVRD